MAEYIKREDAIECVQYMDKKLSKIAFDNRVRIARDILNKMSNYLRKILAADVRENVHGEWIDFDDDYSVYDCSVCGERSPNDIKWHYCPNCGADMRD